MKYSVKNEDPDRLDGREEGGLPKRVNIKAEERSGWGRKGSESENKSKTNLWTGTQRAATQEGLMRSRRLWNYVAFEWGEWP